MADTIQSKFVKSPITLRQLITSSFNSKFKDRWQDPINRDEKHIVRLEQVIVWRVRYREGTPDREKVHTFRIKVFNIKKDGTVNYQTTILMDQLSINVPIKIRCGKQYKYNKGMSRDQMKRKMICGDFRFKFEYIHATLGSLYGRDATNGQPPKVTNPSSTPGLCKHLVTGIKLLLRSSYFQRIDDQAEAKEAKDFINQFGY